MKKSFILHVDSLCVLDELTNEEAGKLFKAIKAFNEGKEINNEPLIRIVFTPFKNQFIRDNESWEQECKVSSDKGKIGNLKRWHNDLYLKVIDNQLTIDEAMAIVVNRHQSPPDTPQSPPIPKLLKNDSVSDSDSKNDSDNKNESKIDFELFWNLYDKKVGVKEKLIKKWNSLGKDVQQQILDYIPNYKLSQPDKKFRKDPATFFNQEAWNNELVGIKSEKPKELLRKQHEFHNDFEWYKYANMKNIPHNLSEEEVNYFKAL